MALVVDGDGARPLPGARHRHDLFGWDRPRPDSSPCRIDDELPPLFGILGDSAAGEVIGAHRHEVGPGDDPVEGDQTHLGTAGADIHSQDEALAKGERTGHAAKICRFRAGITWHHCPR